MRFDLHENLSDDAVLRQGELKSYAKKKDGSMVYESRRSGHSVTVEHLLWLDGWEKTTGDGEAVFHEQEMTLVVLKLVITSEDPDTRFGFMKVTIVFEDPSDDGAENEPHVEAWAPFHSEERKNLTTADIRKTSKTEGNLNIGYNGSQISAGHSREQEISWVQQDYEAARSSVQGSPRTGKRNGVTWTVEQNPRQAKGVTQEIWTAVLISRRTTSAYRVRFQIDVRAGSVQEFVDKTRRVFGMHPGSTRPFLVTPWDQTICEYEGRDIIKCIDRGNLGRLRHQKNSTDLNVRWGPKYELEPNTSSEDLKKEGLDRRVSEEEPDQRSKLDDQPGINKTMLPPSHPSVSASTPAPSSSSALPQVSGLPHHSAGKLSDAAGLSTLPPLLIGWYQGATPIVPRNTDLERLTALESRVAQLEARLASQESTIWQLREAMASKNV